ncbi:MAG: hypothetical protein ACXW3E_15140 [Thermoanaerobaculia bacterium]
MAIILPFPMTPQEMRVLQEFRRIAADSMGIAAIKALKHPAGGGEAPALSLIEKGYLTADATRENFTLTEKAKTFLAIDARPATEEIGGDAGEPTA